jgi:hypothetical protein
MAATICSSSSFWIPSVKSTPSSKVPPEGTIRRCPHGQYLGVKDHETSPYCRLCGSAGNPLDARPVVLPYSSGDPLNENDCLKANRHNGIACPACGSTIYCRVKENGSDSNRECADCGKRYHVHSVALPELVGAA